MPTLNRTQPTDNSLSQDNGVANPWDAFLKARVAAIGWLHQRAQLNDGEIAKAMSVTATEVFLVRARLSGVIAHHESDDAITRAAPLGDS